MTKLFYEYIESDIPPVEEAYSAILESIALGEDYKATANKIKFEICDVDKFVKINKCQAITNPITFLNDYETTEDGLLSNTIFGTTAESRAGIFAYIDLGGTFIDPSCYKTLIKLDSRYKSLIHETEKFVITPQGLLEQSDSGKTGIKFLKDNIDKIKFKTSDSIKRDLNIDYINHNKHRMFITKYLVIPPYYRDVNSNNKSKGLGAINKMYVNLIRFSNALKDSQDYGFDTSSSTKARIQEELLKIYDWACGNNNPNINKKDVGTGLSGKFGIIRRTNRSKTVDYASRLVLSAGDMKVERREDIMADVEYSAMPLAAVIADFYPHMIFHIKKFFMNRFGSGNSFNISSNEVVRVDNPMKQFNEDRIKAELDNFLNSYNNRFKAIGVKCEDGVERYLRVRTQITMNGSKEIRSTIDRKMTWCDLFFICASEAVENAHILITRYPIDTYWNEFTTKIRISSTKETIPAIVNGKFYRWYPKIEEDEIGTNTGNKFIDTFTLSNLFLDSIGGDYDGDTVIVRGVYTEEANKELEEHMYSKRNMISIGGELSRVNTKDAIHSVYCFTRILPDARDKLTNPVF